MNLSEKGLRVWGVGWLVEDVACIRGALGRPREDVADAAHVHQRGGLRRLRQNLTGRTRLQPGWRSMDME